SASCSHWVHTTFRGQAFASLAAPCMAGGTRRAGIGTFMSIRSHHRTTERSSRSGGAPRRRAMTRLLGVLAIAGVLVAGATLAPHGGITAAATVPGTPGTPQPGTPVYTENFSNQN